MGAVYRHTIDGVLRRSHLDSAYITYFAVTVIGAIADKTALYDDAMGLRRNHKVSTLIRHATTKQCGVGRIEDGNVGVCHGLSLLVDNASRQVTVCLVDTLHEDIPGLRVACIDNHADGIEAYHLLDGIGQRLAADGSGDAEILQFVV